MLGKMMTNMMKIIISGSFHGKNHAKPWVGEQMQKHRQPMNV